MKILLAASEAVPFIKTGGLADVTGALLQKYKKIEGLEANLILPLYNKIKENFELKDTGKCIAVSSGDILIDGKLWSDGQAAYFIECRDFFDRPEPYGTPEGDYPDNAARFAFFSRAVLEACKVLGFIPDLIHCHDWQTGLIPLYLKTLYADETFKKTASVFTIHNLGYQGLFDASEFGITGLGQELFNPEGIEFYGKINFLKAGLIAADILTTVSPAYAGEILTPEYGHGLDGVLRKRSSDLYGVINGIDTEYWNPQDDQYIPERYEAEDFSGKTACKKSLLEECSFRDSGMDSPVIALIGRLAAQKGLDLIFSSLDKIISMGAKIIMLGKGDKKYQTSALEAAKKHKGNFYLRMDFGEEFSHRIYAGSDIFLIPSQYEPCGLGQLIAMRYGTVPVARKTGGLSDTIKDYEPLKSSGTGFLFEEYSAAALRECLRSALCIYSDKKRWGQLVSEAMKTDFSWKNSANKYLELYKKATKKLMDRP